MHPLTLDPNHDESLANRTAAIFQQQLETNHKRTDRMFAWLMGLQWLAGIVAALLISPKTWEGQFSYTHIHVWAAIFLGGAISGFPVFLAIKHPGLVLTRQVIAVGQMLSCGLLIHLTGGRIETHFQYFGALAFLAFYRDWRVLLTASVVATADHFIRGYFWPQSIFGVLVINEWRPFEHAGWIIYEDIILVLLIRQNLLEMLGVAERQAKLESVNEIIERKVDERTSELRNEVAERKQAEETLRESEEKFRQLADNITDVFWITSPDLQKTIYVSPAFALIWGRSAASVYAHPLEWVEAIIPEERERVFALFSTLGTGAPSVSVEFQIMRPDGEMRWIHSRGFPIRDASGKVIRLAGIASDITERKLAEKQLERLRNEHMTILNSVSEGMHWVNVEGQIRFENPAAARMLGYEISELVGRPAHLTIHHSHADGAPYPVTECPIYATIKDEVTRRVKDEVFWRKDGTSFPVEYTTTPVRDENGRPDGVVVVFTDMSERKLLEARMFQSQKMETVGKLAGGVAHEFNSILTAIIGQTELLLSDLPPGDPLGENAREIRQAADRAATLTRQLLAYGRKQILQPEILDLNHVLANMVGTLEHLLGREVDVRIVPAVGLKTVKIDPGQVEQVIVNIAMNAADAMPNGGKLTFETANVTLDEEYVRSIPGLKPGGYVMLGITDTGIGMSEEVKARAFEPFYSTKGVGQGTGLGLATCYGLLKQSDGHINVYSEVARGATFKIYLPQVEPPVKVSLPPLKSLDLPRGTETILLAEDDPSLLEMSATLLRRLGYTVLTATNGVEALNLKNQRNIGRIDLLFTDIVMPHMSGKELSDRIWAIYPHTKILFTSAYTENAIVHQGILNEGVTLLQKPYTPSTLANKVREVLDRPLSSPR